MKRIVVASTLFAVATAICLAQDVDPQPIAQRVIRRVEHRLHVTDTQRAQAKIVLSAEAPSIRRIHEQLAAEHAEMVAVSANGVFNEAASKAIAIKYAQSNEEAILEREKVRTELMAILTPDQQKKFEDLRAHFSAAFDEHIDTLGDNL